MATLQKKNDQSSLFETPKVVIITISVQLQVQIIYSLLLMKYVWMQIEIFQ